MRGNIFFPMGKIESCRAEHEYGLAYARQSRLPEAEARALGGLADALYAQGRMRTAFDHFSRCVELSRMHGFGRIEVANRPMVGFCRLYLNEPHQACEDGAEAVRTARLVGQPRAEMLGETISVFAHYELGAFAAMQGHLERELVLIRQLGAGRFEAQNLELRARVLHDTGGRTQAIALLRQARLICGDVGMQFSGPKLLGALSRMVDTKAKSDRLLAQAEELLELGAVAHNHYWFYRDAIEASLTFGDVQNALAYADCLEAYTQDEPLPWSELFVARGRALAQAQQRGSERLRSDLERVRAALVKANLLAFLPPVEVALAAA